MSNVKGRPTHLYSQVYIEGFPLTTEPWSHSNPVKAFKNDT